MRSPADLLLPPTFSIRRRLRWIRASSRADVPTVREMAVIDARARTSFMVVSSCVVGVDVSPVDRCVVVSLDFLPLPRFLLCCFLSIGVSSLGYGRYWRAWWHDFPILFRSDLISFTSQSAKRETALSQAKAEKGGSRTGTLTSELLGGGSTNLLPGQGKEGRRGWKPRCVDPSRFCPHVLFGPVKYLSSPNPFIETFSRGDRSVARTMMKIEQSALLLQAVVGASIASIAEAMKKEEQIGIPTPGPFPMSGFASGEYTATHSPSDARSKLHRPLSFGFALLPPAASRLHLLKMLLSAGTMSRFCFLMIPSLLISIPRTYDTRHKQTVRGYGSRAGQVASKDTEIREEATTERSGAEDGSWLRTGPADGRSEHKRM